MLRSHCVYQLHKKFALFPSLYPEGWNVSEILQNLTGSLVQRMHVRKNRQKKTLSLFKQALRYVEMLSKHNLQQNAASSKT